MFARYITPSSPPPPLPGGEGLTENADTSRTVNPSLVSPEVPLVEISEALVAEASVASVVLVARAELLVVPVAASFTCPMFVCSCPHVKSDIMLDCD